MLHNDLSLLQDAGHLGGILRASHDLRQALVDALPSCGTEPHMGPMNELITLREGEEEEAGMALVTGLCPTAHRGCW